MLGPTIAGALEGENMLHYYMDRPKWKSHEPLCHMGEVLEEPGKGNWGMFND